MDEKKIDRLNKLLEQRISFKRNFFLGIVAGIGSAIGALLIGTLLVSFVISNIERIPLLKDLLPQKTVEEYIIGD